MNGIDLISKERTRQIEVENWSDGHDDGHTDESLIAAAISYAANSPKMVTRIYDTDISGGRGECPVWGNISIKVPTTWPKSWHGTHWNPKDRIHNLTVAGALIAAEIDRLQRMHDRPAG